MTLTEYRVRMVQDRLRGLDNAESRIALDLLAARIMRDGSVTAGDLSAVLLRAVELRRDLGVI